MDDEDVVGEGESEFWAAVATAGGGCGGGEMRCCIASLHSLVVAAEQPDALTSSSSSSSRSRLSSSSRSRFRIAVDLFSDSVKQDGAIEAVENEKPGGFGCWCCLLT